MLDQGPSSWKHLEEKEWLSAQPRVAGIENEIEGMSHRSIIIGQ